MLALKREGLVVFDPKRIGAVLDKMNTALQSGDRTEYRALDAELHDVILSHGNMPDCTA